MQKITLLLVVLLLVQTSQSQEIIQTLNGISLGQFRGGPTQALLGVLQSDKFEDGYEFEIHLVEPDTSVYMIFEFTDYDLNTIWSAQITGSKDGYDCRFKGLKLGMKEKEIKKIIGSPSSVESAGDYGVKWIYENTNYSLEITPKGRLGGIKIIDLSYEFYPNVLVERIPPFDIWMKLISSKERSRVASILAPGIEVYNEDSTYAFRNSIDREITEDASGVFQLLKEASESLAKIDLNDSLQYEENMRLALGENPMHVVKASADDQFIELVFKFMFGKYLIWEIRLVDTE